MTLRAILTALQLLLAIFSFSQNIHLEVNGKDSISTEFTKTLNISKTFKDLKSIDKEVSKLKNIINNRGYFNAVFENLKKLNDSTYLFSIKTNKLYNKIVVYHKNLFTQKELLEKLTQNTTINKTHFTTPTPELEKNLNNLIKLLTNKGETFSSLKLTNIKTKKNTVFADLTINHSKTNHITEVKIKGYDKFPRKFIKHYLRLKPNQKLNPEELEKKSNYINNLRFAKELKKPEILFSKDSTIIYLYTEKRKSNSFDGFIGFSTNPETNKIEFNGNLNLHLINNLNSGEELLVKYHSTENEQKDINIKTIIPYIFNSPFNLEGSLNIFKKDSSFINNQQSICLKYQLSNSIKLGGGMRFTNSNSLKNESQNNIDLKKNTFLLSLEHIKLNPNKLFPYKTRTLLETAFSKKKTPINNTQQQELSLSTEYIFELNNTNSISLKNQSYYLISEEVLENELQYIGGINSIRGFQENSIPSSLYSILNTEYRIILNQNLYINSVTDFGITQNYTSKKIENLIGLGFGFGLKTNNNLLKFIFANSKTKDENFKFSNSKIHLSLNTTF